MFVELHYCHCCCHWCCYSYCFYSLCACHVPYHCSLHHYQHEYYKCWQAVNVLWQLLHICPSEEGRRGIPHLWCSFRVLLYPKRVFFICFFQNWVEGPNTEGVTSAQIVLLLTWVRTAFALAFSKKEDLIYQTTGAGMERVLLPVPNLLTDTSNMCTDC